jgi:hypothetical protein
VHSLHWYEYLLLDVLAFVAAVITVAVVGTVCVCRKVCCRRKRSDSKPKKE